MVKRALGTCYYPEHWPREQWPEDAQRMAKLGLQWVRIGEFAWSRIEPAYGEFDWQWLDEAIEVLGKAGLKVVLGTPTATPPRWMIDRHPDMVAVDEQGNPRKFGSRRHYCFSHLGFQAESQRITEMFAKRYGLNKHVVAWQTDNEYGCHDTVISYSPPAQQAFRAWCEAKYKTIQALNEAWGNVFWSMEYSSFEQIDLPNLTVTEANPAHRMAFRRFSSDQVVQFNRQQVDIIRQYTDAPVAHNYMGRITEFDHFDVGDDLDIASWDSYPLGFLEDRIVADDQFKHDHARQGHPDFQAFHHDLYRAVGKGRWWVMEQQPGPVNWAPYNPAPLRGMVRLWTWEAFAHGAENVVYFRWRQAPFAQEQMHSGLLRPDSETAPAFDEAAQVVRELNDLGDDDHVQSDVALVFDYQSNWATDIQPQGKDCHYFDLVFDHYCALRKLGLSVDILPPTCADLSAYKLVLIPGLTTLSDPLRQAIKNFDGTVLAGPRTNAKTSEFAIPTPLPPNLPGLNCTIEYVESLRSTISIELENGGALGKWREEISGEFNVVEKTLKGVPAVVEQNNMIYVAAWLDQSALGRVLGQICAQNQIETEIMPASVRRRDTRTQHFYFNYGATAQEIAGQTIEPAGVFWKPKSST
ncbi:beta-galactosidase [Maritalea sp.]|uniref:beta-galactosidase n=1 Tax=Maritalea sp. TaxID=2003361 RepID=UPI003EF1F28D